MTRLLAQSHPVETYLSNLSAGSRPGTRQALDLIAAFLSGDEHDRRSFPWHEVRYQHTVAVRAHLVEKYQPSTVNRMLASLRGVLKETWRLGQMDAETYRRAIDVPNLWGSVLPRGRALQSGELGSLFVNGWATTPYRGVPAQRPDRFEGSFDSTAQAIGVTSARRDFPRLGSSSKSHRR